MRLREIASDQTPSIHASATAQEALNAMRLQGANALVVCGEKTVAGVVTEAQLIALSKGERDGRQASDVATEVVPLPGDATIKDAANAMRRLGVDCIPVIDDGRVVGPKKRVLTSTAEAPAVPRNPRQKTAGPGRFG